MPIGLIINRCDLTGQKFGFLRVIDYAYTKKKRAWWNCVCDCGNNKTAKGHALKTKHITSCGCMKNEGARIAATTHGHTSRHKLSGTYSSYKAMRNRCTNPNQPAYADYGARGITICDDWMESFENFLRDMGDRPEGYSLERKNVHGGYNKNNCCWIPRKQQAKNKTTTRRVLVDGKEMIQSDAAKYLGVPHQALIGWRKKPHTKPNNVTFMESIHA